MLLSSIVSLFVHLLSLLHLLIVFLVACCGRLLKYVVVIIVVGLCVCVCSLCFVVSREHVSIYLRVHMERGDIHSIVYFSHIQCNTV